VAYKVTLGNPSRTTRRRPGSNPVDGSGDDGKLGMSRLTYQALGSLVQNKALINFDINGNITGGTYTNKEIPLEYVRVLDELNDLFLKKNYPELGEELVIKDGIVALDEYLGSLGVDIIYPYTKDITNIPAWLEIDSQTEYRVLVDLKDNTYLTKNNEREILVVYT